MSTTPGFSRRSPGAIFYEQHAKKASLEIPRREVEARQLDHFSLPATSSIRRAIRRRGLSVDAKAEILRRSHQ